VRNDAPEWVHVWFWMRYRRRPPDMRVLPQMDPYDERERMSEEEATALLAAWVAAGSPKVSLDQIVGAMTGTQPGRNDE
jgi:hypothetical protein